MAEWPNPASPQPESEAPMGTIVIASSALVLLGCLVHFTVFLITGERDWDRD
jgi:hypothetical protein